MCSSDLRFQASGHLIGDTLTLDNVRAFRWRTRREFNEVWERRTYDDVLSLEAEPLPAGATEPATEPAPAADASPSTKDP